MSKDLHVVPRNDEREHDLTRWCLCEPTVQAGECSDVVVHNAWDCREYVEAAEVIIEGIRSSTYTDSRWMVVKS